MDSTDKPSTDSGESVPRESVSKAASELNNLLQIISGTSAELGQLYQGSSDSEKYLDVLRESIERAEKVAAQLTEQAGGEKDKMRLHPELAAFLRPKSVMQMPMAKPQILIVDDEEAALTLVKQLLAAAGFNVSSAQSGFEALDLFRRRPLDYQLVLVDLSMPFMDGEETFHRLREIREDIPVVLCTGFIQNDRLERMMTAGLAGFLRKPLSPDEIVGSVRSILESVKYSRGGATFAGGSPSIG